MSDEIAKRRRTDARSLVPDHDLWERVKSSVRPISAEPLSVTASSLSENAEERRTKTNETGPKSPGNRRSGKIGSRGKPLSPARATLELTGLDRRTARRLLRGAVEIEERLDLHGESGESARVRLFSFLAAGVAAGRHYVLVITGKGHAPFARHTLHGLEATDLPERQGRLRRLFQEWMAEPEFRALVSGYQPAHPRHGGGGAFYVKLRRKADKSRGR